MTDISSNSRSVLIEGLLLRRHTFDQTWTHNDRLWNFFMMRAPSAELELLWLTYASMAATIIEELPQSPERTLALRALLTSRAEASLAGFEVVRGRRQA